MTQCASAMGGGRPRTKSNPRSNLGRSMTYVRRQCSTRFVPRWLLTRDRQPLGSSPNHAHATEDNTPCWGESAVATRVGFNPDGSSTCIHYPCTLPPTGQQRVRVRRRHRVTTRVVVPHTTGLNPVVVPHTTGLRHVVVPHTTGSTPSWYTLLSPRFVPRLTSVFLPYGY